MERSAVFESQDVPEEEEFTVEIKHHMEKIMETLHYPGRTKRMAHPKTLGLLAADFIVTNSALPTHLRVGIFSRDRVFKAWVRFAGTLPIQLPDSVPEPKGCSIKLVGVEGERFVGSAQDEKETQDFVLISGPTQPFGTLKAFRDAVVIQARYSPLVFFAKMLWTLNLRPLFAALKFHMWMGSPFDCPYYSTTAFLLGPNNAVRYGLFPTSQYKSTTRNSIFPHYLSDNMRTHLKQQDATFDFKVQLHKGPSYSIEDASVAWDEVQSPFIKVAELRIKDQRFITAEREELSERLAFNVGHAIRAHKPLGAMNRARVRIYQELAHFRMQRDEREQADPLEAMKRAGVDM